MHNKFSDKAIRQKPFSEMSPAEAALFTHQASQQFEKLKQAYGDEPQMLLALSKLLEQEHSKFAPKEQPKPTQHEDEFNLFGGSR